ncbi:energy transducer TonB [Flavobacterium sp.]|uniref:energy transducer TonB n=1 Tax=Flavobacterium sp. TaxID=239 RepID=UPI00286E6C0E|nr:energy transducer TonB [Flavobacterium sp.]
MSKLNSNKNEWLELVFEGKNKEYGAYQLRKEEANTTIKAFFVSIGLLTSFVGIILLSSSFTVEKTPEIPPSLESSEVIEVIFPEKEEIKVEPVLPKKAAVKNPVETTELIDPTIVEQKKASTDEITKNENLENNNSNNTSGNTVENTSGNENTTNTNIIEPTKLDPNAIKGVFELDKKPNFPGGINEFLKTVGKKFVAPEMEEEKIIKVIVYFVVEKDGTLSNITVPNNPGFGMDKEAIRVLKSIKTKWEAGVYKGEKVRTSYSLPIMVKTEFQE